MRKLLLSLTLMTVMVAFGGGVALADHDTGWPRLIGSSPAPGEAWINKDRVTVTFDESIDSSTLLTSDGYNNVEIYKWNKKKKKYLYVPTALTCDTGCTTITADPYPQDSRFLPKGKYKVVVWRDIMGLRGADGNRISNFAPAYKTGGGSGLDPDYFYWTFNTAVI